MHNVMSKQKGDPPFCFFFVEVIKIKDLTIIAK